MTTTEAEYEEWAESVDARVRNESIWKLYAYRKSLWAYELAWHDCDRLATDIRGGHRPATDTVGRLDQCES